MQTADQITITERPDYNDRHETTGRSVIVCTRDGLNRHTITHENEQGRFYTASYISDGDGFGRSIFCGSAKHKTRRGAMAWAARRLR